MKQANPSWNFFAACRPRIFLFLVLLCSHAICALHMGGLAFGIGQLGVELVYFQNIYADLPTMAPVEFWLWAVFCIMLMVLWLCHRGKIGIVFYVILLLVSSFPSIFILAVFGFPFYCPLLALFLIGCGAASKLIAMVERRCRTRHLTPK